LDAILKTSGVRSNVYAVRSAHGESTFDNSVSTDTEQLWI